jgi:hypothetical protein
MDYRHNRRDLLMTLPLAEIAPQKVSAIYYIMLVPFYVSLLYYIPLFLDVKLSYYSDDMYLFFFFRARCMKCWT